MIRFALFVLLLGAPLAHAQAPTAAAPHALPFPGATPEAHAVELALGGAAQHGLRVRVAAAPPWLRFETPEAEAAAPDGSAGEAVARTSSAGTAADPVARLAFAVERSAPVGEPATVELVVTDAAGRERARHAFAVVVEAPELTLSAPRPNPSRGGARVAFTTAGEAVRLSVLDVLGREVAVLAQGALAAGAHEARLPALASGAYVVRLASGGEGRAERFTVVR